MSLPPELFERHYLAERDPFHYEGNPFELTKYHAQLALLTDRHFNSGLELGCSIGIFTALLAPRCRRLLAIDFAPTAIAQVRTRCAGLPHVSAEVAVLPAEFPPGTFDLVTFSEFGYYLSSDDLAELRERITQASEPGAQLVISHMAIELAPYWDHPLTSTHVDVHRPFEQDARWTHRTRLKGYEDDFYGEELYWADLFVRV
ncbi:MAG: methyltransferase domain-containing protein [Candidatus Eremiobacteraeota bacterium]|nr:methyltransferase domain-containing protein [Candidatus Eremiobacteraeota bacterium]